MQLNYQTYGKGSPLIVLHGLFGMLDNWHSVGKMLGEYFQVFLVDQRNHGRSPHSAEMDYEAMARDILEFSTQHRIPTFHLLGHSMGGKVAMKTALSFPGSVEKLIVIDIAPRLYPSFHDSILNAMTSIDLKNFSTRQAVDGALSVAIHEQPVRQFLMKNLARNEDDSFRWKLNLPVIALKYQNMLEEVKSSTPYSKPTLFIRSKKSSYIGEGDIPHIKRLFPDSTFTDFETGHWVHAEAPELLVKTVVDFLLRT